MKGKEEVSSKIYLMITIDNRGEHIGILLDSNTGIVTAINIARNDYFIEVEKAKENNINAESV